MKILLSIIGVALWVLGLIILIETAEPQDFGTSVDLSNSTNQPQPAIPRRQALVPSFPELNLVAIQGYRAVSKEQVRELYSLASYYFREVGLNFRINYIDRESNPCEYFHNYTVMGMELNCFKSDARAQGYRRKKVLIYYMLPPWIIVNEPYGPQTALIAGIAEKICGQVAIGNATSVSLRDGVEGESRIDHSATVLAHEVMHLMCAKHIDSSPNLMHSAANVFTSEYGGKLPVHWLTQRQVKRWYVKRRKL